MFTKAELATSTKCKLIFGTGQLANLLKNINKTVGEFNITKQMTITGKWHGCHFKKWVGLGSGITYLLEKTK